MKSTAVLTTLLLILVHTALAVPQVDEIIPSFPETCTGYPNNNYGPSDDRAGPFQIITDATPCPSTNILTIYTQEFTTADGTQISILVANRCARCAAANVLLRCNLGQVDVSYRDEGPFRIARDPNNALPSSQDGYTPGVYRHRIGGVDQGHNYWGAENRTTWGFKAVDDGDIPYFLIRLLGLPEVEGVETKEPEWEPEFEGFVRVIIPWLP